MHRFKQLTWLTTLWSAALFFILPVLQSMQLGLMMPNKTLYLGKDEVNQLLAEQNYLVLAGVLVTGIIAACVVQAFMNSKTQNDLWLSLPVRREKLFAVNLTAGAMAVLIPLTVAYALTSIMTVLVPDAAASFDFSAVFTGYLRAVGLFAVAYAITTLWCVLSGRTIIAVLCTLFTPAIGSATAGLAVLLVLMQFKTFYYTQQTMKILIELCPFAPFFATSIADKLITTMEIVWAAVAVILLLLSVRLFQKRSPEKAGDALVYSKALPIVKYPLVFLSTALGWVFFKLITSETGWAIFGAIAIGLCVFCLVNVLEKFDFRNILHHWWKFIATAAVFGLCIGILILDPLSYDTRLPAREKITEAKVYQLTINGIDLNPSSNFQQTIKDPEIIDSLYNLSQFVVGREEYLSYNTSFGYRNDPSDIPFSDISNAYGSKHLLYTVDYNGFIRQYSAFISDDQEKLLVAIFSNPKVIMKTNGAYTYTADEIELMTIEFSNISMSYTVKDTVATGPENNGAVGDVIYALRSGALTTTAEKLENAHLLCVLHIKGEDGKTVRVPVYDFYEKTRNIWLWPVIENHMLKTDPALIESIRVERLYDNFSQTVTDSTQIAELAPALITYMDTDYNPLISTENDYTVTVTYKDDSVSYPRLCDQQLPDWLKN